MHQTIIRHTTYRKATSISTDGFHTNSFILFSRDNKMTIKFATILRPRDSEMSYLQGLEGIVVYSNSIVAGGLLVQSYITRFTPLTSFTMRFVTLWSTSQGICALSAVMKSLVITARSAMA